jgi:DNA-nicking Smr family endonuclease
MRKLDLHGIRHHEVRVLVEDFIYMNQQNFPLEIICGNSEKMIQLVENTIRNMGVETHSFRYGVIIIDKWR